MILSGAMTAEVKDYLKSRTAVLVPVGSLEQHGNAAPLGCDTIIPVRLCNEAGRKTGIAVTPAISFGMSENHMEFPGTVTLLPETLSAVARDVSVSLYTHGFKKVVFLSGHGGNRGPVTDGLVTALNSCPDADFRYLLYRDLPGVIEEQRRLFCPDPGYHVTVTEVSMVWYLIGMDLPEFDRIKFPPEPSAGEILSRKEWKDRYPDGGAGADLSFVSAEKGKELFKFLVKSLCLYIDELERADQ